MKQLLIILCISVFLMGCQTPPIKAPFPEPPAKLMDPPRQLKVIRTADEDNKIKLTDGSASGIPLSVVMKIITENYTTCNLNAEQLKLLQEWAREQQKLNN